MSDHLAFQIRRTEIRDGILIPKFYDPELEEGVRLAEEKALLPELGELLLPGEEGSRLGTWIPREHYGSGSIPYARTSDISHWRIRADFKKGVSEQIYDKFAAKQDIRLGDILLVAHGTYLVGSVAIVTAPDTKVLIQDHIFRLRLRPDVGFDSWLLLAALSTKFVRRQVRARQFSADIIDKIGERHLGIRVPIPRDQKRRTEISANVQRVISSSERSREIMRHVSGSDMRMMRPRAEARYCFPVHRKNLRQQILIPKYYDPDLQTDLALEKTASKTEWTTLASLVEEKVLSISPGIEVGKMAYGTGNIPFIRTSDIVDWGLRHQPRQGVSEQIFRTKPTRATLKRNDILLVRDGTYLVGSTALVLEEDLPALYCGGILKLRVTSGDENRAYALLAFLNLPIVRRQMRARQFTRDVIDTLGKRIMEVEIPRLDGRLAADASEAVRKLVKQKSERSVLVRSILERLEPMEPKSSMGRPGTSMRK